MKNIIVWISSFTLLITNVTLITSNVISCSLPSNQIAFQTVNYKYLQNTGETFKIAYKKWNEYTSIGQWIKKYMVENFIIKVDKEKLLNNKNIVEEEVHNQIIDWFSANLRLWHMINLDEALNPSNVEINILSVDKVKNDKYPSQTFKAEIFAKNNNQVKFEISGQFVGYSFEPVEMLDEFGFKTIMDNIKEAGNRFLYQEIFLTVDFIGKKKPVEESICKNGEQGCNWDGQQYLDKPTLEKMNLDFLSSRLRATGIIPMNKLLDYQELNVDVMSEMLGKGKIYPEIPTKIFFEESDDFGRHSILFKTYIYFPGNQDLKLETWGSYLKSDITY